MTEAQPIIFLDFDGVIRNRGWRSDWIANLNTLIREFNARIVVSSDWRHSNNRKELRCRLGEQGIIGWMQADETPIVIPTQDLETMDWFEPRRTEIQDWFLRTAYEGPYVILDDMVPLKTTEYGPRMVLCDWDLGFDGTALEQARNILKEQMK